VQFWLLGYEFPATLILITTETIYILTTAKKGQDMKWELSAGQKLMRNSKIVGAAQGWKDSSRGFGPWQRFGAK